MKAVIISIGNELLAGRTVNTNAAYLGRMLTDMGIRPIRMTTVPDEKEALVRELDEALQAADVIITTGGLGPTNDDITREVITEYFGGRLIFREEIWERIQQMFTRRNLPVPEVNRNQAFFPDNAELLENEVGTAPGMLFRKEGKYVFVLPGVPREMTTMMEQSVLPRLKSLKNLTIPPRMVFRTIGIAESALYERVMPVLQRYPEADFMFYPSYLGVDLKIFCREGCHPEALQTEILALIETFCFSTDENRSIMQVIQEIFIQNRWTLAAAESCTGGLLQHLLTEIPGSSEYFLGGVVSYSNDAKMRFLGVREEDLKEYGAVSEPVARAMAVGVKERFESSMGVGITGIAGPGGGTATKPVGLVYIGVAMEDEVWVRHFQFGTDRQINKMRSAGAALGMIWKMVSRRGAG